jgi:aspartate carbamoyltransferase catalytic subunit
VCVSYEKKLSTRHLWSVEQLSEDDILSLFSWAKQFSLMSSQELLASAFLKSRVVGSLFFENSTRTYLSFYLAVRKLSAELVQLGSASSSLSKGETLLDTIRNMEALGCSLLVIRHYESGIVEKLAGATNMGVINAGDGENEHPTQALLDAFTLWQRFSVSERKLLHGLKIAIVGDIKHSRVAKSNMRLLPRLGAEVHVAGPTAFMPSNLYSYQVRYVKSIDEAILGADAVMMLRIQQERLMAGEFPVNHNYFEQFGLNMSRFLQMASHAVVLHPGPVNRGVEIADNVADHPRSLILDQVKNGVLMRMAVLYGLDRAQTT